MRFGRGNSRQNNSTLDLYVFIALTLVSFLTLFFSTRDGFSGVKNIGLSMFSGIRAGIYEVNSFISRSVMSIQELAALRREHAELVARIARYEQLERTAAEIRQENFRLREQLGFSQNLRFRHIPAQVIGRDPGNLYSAFVINKGQQAGVQVNMPVIAYHNATQGLVGIVINAGAFESLVMPLYDTSYFVSARLSESRYEGIVEGRGNPDTPLLMRFINRRARDEIFPGDMVVTSGLGSFYPAGINIGRVSRINFQAAELSMELEIEPSIDFSRMESVFVISGEFDD